MKRSLQVSRLVRGGFVKHSLQVSRLVRCFCEVVFTYKHISEEVPD